MNFYLSLAQLNIDCFKKPKNFPFICRCEKQLLYSYNNRLIGLYAFLSVSDLSPNRMRQATQCVSYAYSEFYFANQQTQQGRMKYLQGCWQKSIQGTGVRNKATRTQHFHQNYPRLHSHFEWGIEYAFMLIDLVFVFERYPLIVHSENRSSHPFCVKREVIIFRS